MDKAISQFGKLIVWEKDHDHMATVLDKARVSALDAIPLFFNFTESSEPESDCWAIQCEILLTRLLGAQPQDEDFPLEDLDFVDPNNFDFFGFWQPDQGPANPPNGPQNHFNANATNLQVMGWAPWPPQVDGQFAAQVQQVFQAAQVANIVFVEPQQFDA